MELLALKEVQLGTNTNISHVQNERLIMQAVPPHQFVVGMLYAFRTPRSCHEALQNQTFHSTLCFRLVLPIYFFIIGGRAKANIFDTTPTPDRFLYYALDFMNGGDLFRHWRKHRNRRTEMAPFYASEVQKIKITQAISIL